MKWIVATIFVIIYLPCAYIGLVFVTVVHGDCWIGGDSTQIAACVSEKRIVIITYGIVALALFSLMLWLVLKTKAKR